MEILFNDFTAKLGYNNTKNYNFTFTKVMYAIDSANKEELSVC